jgi:tetratricopeptide (TPR) repeat protein/pimeloyl-ACP methyl ester carboxylesterase
MRLGALWLGCLLLSWGICAAVSRADDLELRNGAILTGTARRIATMTTNVSGSSKPTDAPIWMVDDGVRRFFTHRRNVARYTESGAGGANVSFKMKHERGGRTAGFSNVGGFVSVQPFDEYGRRTVRLPTQKGMVDIIQGVGLIRPDFAVIESLTHVWEYTVDTRTLPRDVIQSLIRRTSNQDDPAERKAAVLFYLQAQMYEEAREELALLAQRFPDLTDWCQEYERRVGEFIALRAMNELERRQAAGQHLLAMQFAQKFPEEYVSAEVWQRSQEIVQQYQQAIVDRDRILLLLDTLQADLPEPQFTRLSAMRALLREELYYESLSRLEPFLRTAEDESLTPQEKLALAYSGWLLGSSGAIVNLDEAIRLWDARFLVLDFLRLQDDPYREEEILQELDAIEGISLERLTQMVRTLPLPFEPPAMSPGTPTVIEMTQNGEEPPRRYTILLPPEYHPSRSYPLLVVLKGEQFSFENAVKWWGGDAANPGWAQRRGYIVLAPHYCAEDASGFDPANPLRDTVLESIQHARKRFQIDSDRIFLTGHGMGGDACFDLGMSHPDLFAGIIPIGGICPQHCRQMRENGPSMSWYVVFGEKDRGLMEKNAYILNAMMKSGQDVICCEYKGRGFESYHEEQERIFGWMQMLRRPSLKEVGDWSIQTSRRSPSRYYWLQARQMNDRAEEPVRPIRFEAQAREGGDSGGTIRVSHPGRATTLWLSPELVNFDKKYDVHVNHKMVSRQFFQPSIGALLSDLRERGDRQRLYWARVDL